MSNCLKCIEARALVFFQVECSAFTANNFHRMIKKLHVLHNASAFFSKNKV